MNILFVSNLYPPVAVGGYERLCADIAGRLAARGHRIAVLTSDHGVPRPRREGFVHRLLEMEGGLFRTGYGNLVQRTGRALRNLRRLRSVLSSFSPDVAFIWNHHDFQGFLLTEIRRRGVPLAFHFGGNWPLLPDKWTGFAGADPARAWIGLAKRTWHSAVSRLFGLQGALADCDLSFSSFSCAALRRDCARAGFAIGSSEIVHEGIPPEDLPPPGWRPSPTSGRAFRILFCGQLAAEKGPQHLVAALDETPLRDIRAEATIVGRGPTPDFENSLRADIARRGLADRVRLLPPVPRPQLADLFRSHDALAFPSVWPEYWSLVLLTAMACGLPAAATATGGTPELVRDGENGLLVPPADAPALARALRRLADDPAMLARLSAQAEADARSRYGIDGMADRHERMLNRALRNRRPKPGRPAASEQIRS